MEADAINGFVTSVPYVNNTVDSIDGVDFEIFQIKNGRIIAGVDVATCKSIKQKSYINIVDGLLPVDYSPGVRKWQGVTHYHAFRTKAEALKWKYAKVAEAFDLVEEKARDILKKNENKKKQIGFQSIENEYPELVL